MEARDFEYVPTVRLKAGEYRALARLIRTATDVADRIRPRLVLPPPGDKDPEAKRVLTKDEILHLTGERIGRHWPLRPAFVEATYLFAAFGESESAIWLPRIFAEARNHHGRPIPLATLDDMTGDRAAAFRLCLSDVDPTKIAIRVNSGEIDNTFEERVQIALATFGLTPGNCALLLDLADADLSDAEAVAEFCGGAMEAIQSAGLWQSVVFQGTHYPERNPAKADSSAFVERNEWRAWSQTVATNDIASRRLIFGDYGADNAKFVFRSGGGAPIRHYRYCTGPQWLVVRGKADVPQAEAMQAVCSRILASGKFAGRDFSSADVYIYETANGRTNGGSATTWREMNTLHHITQVVHDLGQRKGKPIKRRPIAEPAIQSEMFESAKK